MKIKVVRKLTNYQYLDKMYKDFIKTASKTFTDVVPPIMTDAHKEAIEIEVYARYEPTMYNGSVYDYVDRRYGDNGLIDEHNFKYDIEINKNSIVIILYNETKGNQYAPNNQSDIFIDSVIITGKGYSWSNSNIAKSKMQRDFYAMTEKIMESDKVRDKIIKEFNKRGIVMW